VQRSTGRVNSGSEVVIALCLPEHPATREWRANSERLTKYGSVHRGALTRVSSADPERTRFAVLAVGPFGGQESILDVAESPGKDCKHLAIHRRHGEVAANGITVNCVCPGPTDTALLDQVARSSQNLYDSARAIPLKRIAQPSDIAPAVVFVASDDAGYITGEALSVSGGLTMS
jgi:Enoyl-(Acyl carrier protein) reductase